MKYTAIDNASCVIRGRRRRYLRTKPGVVQFLHKSAEVTRLASVELLASLYLATRLEFVEFARMGFD